MHAVSSQSPMYDKLLTLLFIYEERKKNEESLPWSLLNNSKLFVAFICRIFVYTEAKNGKSNIAIKRNN